MPFQTKTSPENAFHQNREEDGTHGINPPNQLCTAGSCEDTKAVDEKIVTVILPENVDLTVLVLESPAVQEESKLCGKSTADGDNSRKMKLLVPLGLGQFLTSKGNDNERDGDHEETKDNVANSLKAGLSSRKSSGIDTANGSS
ncbi:hypothetical protein HG530_000116 [Fusarium avenaceum]|nr:hypothetical protein HG530_000116 [Fusarium avenaceum]